MGMAREFALCPEQLESPSEQMEVMVTSREQHQLLWGHTDSTWSSTLRPGKMSRERVVRV